MIVTCSDQAYAYTTSAIFCSRESHLRTYVYISQYCTVDPHCLYTRINVCCARAWRERCATKLDICRAVTTNVRTMCRVNKASKHAARAEIILKTSALRAHRFQIASHGAGCCARWEHVYVPGGACTRRAPEATLSALTCKKARARYVILK